MRALRLVLVLALVTLAVPGSGGTTPDLSQPLAAFALVQSEGAFLTWTPGPVAPDYFVIYGGEGDAMLPVSVAPSDATFADVSGVYPEYAIAAVVDGTVSKATVAATVTQGCIIIETNPPNVGVGCESGLLGIVSKLGVRMSLMASLI